MILSIALKDGDAFPNISEMNPYKALVVTRERPSSNGKAKQANGLSAVAAFS